jgi:hypothetical protein
MRYNVRILNFESQAMRVRLAFAPIFALLLGVLFLGVSLSAAPAQAADAAQACSAANSGARVCEGGNVCVCRITGGTMYGMPQAFRWDCGIANGNCIPELYAPVAGIPATQGVTTTRTVSTTTTTNRDQMRRLQQTLARRGYDPGPIDGVYGPRTAQAIRGFQHQEKLPVTGLVTPELLTRLN